LTRSSVENEQINKELRQKLIRTVEELRKLKQIVDEYENERTEMQSKY